MRKKTILTVATVTLVLSATATVGRATPATPQELRQQILIERARLARLRQINHRLVRAYMNGPGYISPRNSSWECIHSNEASSWSANTGNGFYGGLQMDASFEKANGPEFRVRFGHANLWPVWAQKIAADRAFVTRGYHPWPRTARMCGLL